MVSSVTEVQEAIVAGTVYYDSLIMTCPMRVTVETLAGEWVVEAGALVAFLVVVDECVFFVSTRRHRSRSGSRTRVVRGEPKIGKRTKMWLIMTRKNGPSSCREARIPR